MTGCSKQATLLRVVLIAALAFPGWAGGAPADYSDRSTALVEGGGLLVLDCKTNDPRDNPPTALVHATAYTVRFQPAAPETPPIRRAANPRFLRPAPRAPPADLPPLNT